MLYFKALLDGLSPYLQPMLQFGQKLNCKRSNRVGAIHKRLQEVDPISAARIHPNDPQRLSRALEVFFSFWKEPDRID